MNIDFFNHTSYTCNGNILEQSKQKLSIIRHENQLSATNINTNDE